MPGRVIKLPNLKIINAKITKNILFLTKINNYEVYKSKYILYGLLILILNSRE